MFYSKFTIAEIGSHRVTEFLCDVTGNQSYCLLLILSQSGVLAVLVPYIEENVEMYMSLGTPWYCTEQVLHSSLLVNKYLC